MAVKPDEYKRLVTEGRGNIDYGELDIWNSGNWVPPKIRELFSDFENAGFVDRGGKGSHRNYVHPKVARPITISGRPGDDAKHYQVRAVQVAIEEAKK